MRPTSASSRASRSCPSKARQVGSSPEARSPTSCTAPTRRSSGTRPTSSPRWRRATRSARAVWEALRTHPNLAVVDSQIVPRKQNYNFGAVSDFKLAGFYVEDRSIHARPDRGARPADRQEPPAHRHRRAVRHGPARDGRHLDVADHARGHLRKPRGADRALVCAQARRRSGSYREGARVGLPRERHAGRRVEEHSSQTPSRRASPSTASSRASWASA